jgi:hypothetical protein
MMEPERPRSVPAWKVSTPVPDMPIASPTVWDTARRMDLSPLYLRVRSSRVVASTRPLRSMMSPMALVFLATFNRLLSWLVVQREPWE